ncbi:MAG: hypothetical protein GWN29_09550, partial [Gammaproteobacteria bacterium]|nr:hypothetical protein [Gammaproteobacteria bacterium]
MNDAAQRRPTAERFSLSLLVLTGTLAWQTTLLAQDAPVGEWRNIAGDAAATRYLPVDQINADNFNDLEVAWVWRGDNFGPGVDYLLRSTPIYVDGLLYTVAGQRRTVVAIDPA